MSTEVVSPSLAPEAPLGDALLWALGHAAMAPSELNSQPWLFRVVGGTTGRTARVELTLNEASRLPVVDPDDREAVLACGAALMNLRLALHGAELATEVRLCPDPQRSDLLAQVLVGGTTKELAHERPLRLAIPVRRTHRDSFEPAAVPSDEVDQLIAEAGYEGAPVAVLDDAARSAVQLLNTRGSDQLWRQTAFRDEIASWSRSNTSKRTDGVPGFSHGLTTLSSWLEPSRLRSGRSTVAVTEAAAQDRDPAPVLLVIGAADDSHEAVLRSGAGMQRLLLRATDLGLAASYQNAALHVPELRRALARAVDLDHPQVVLRVGYGHGGRPGPRSADRLGSGAPT
jgi:hypothetical protein